MCLDKGGHFTIAYNNFDIDESIPFEEQWYLYKEDILQVKFGDRFILDVGWHPEGSIEGNFKVLAILNNDWNNPVSKLKAYTLTELKAAIERTATFINEIRKIKDIPYRDVKYE